MLDAVIYRILYLLLLFLLFLLLFFLMMLVLMLLLLLILETLKFGQNWGSTSYILLKLSVCGIIVLVDWCCQSKPNSTQRQFNLSWV